MLVWKLMVDLRRQRKVLLLALPICQMGLIDEKVYHVNCNDCMTLTINSTENQAKFNPQCKD